MLKLPNKVERIIEATFKQVKSCLSCQTKLNVEAQLHNIRCVLTIKVIIIAPMYFRPY